MINFDKPIEYQSINLDWCPARVVERNYKPSGVNHLKAVIIWIGPNGHENLRVINHDDSLIRNVSNKVEFWVSIFRSTTEGEYFMTGPYKSIEAASDHSGTMASRFVCSKPITFQD